MKTVYEQIAEIIIQDMCRCPEIGGTDTLQDDIISWGNSYPHACRSLFVTFREDLKMAITNSLNKQQV